MLKSLYVSTALALLPSTEKVLKKFEGLVRKLDAQTVHLEHVLEDKAVALAKNSQHRRSAKEAVERSFTEVIAKIATAGHALIDTVEDAFARRERRVLTDISSLRDKLERASSARDAVSNILNK